MKKNKISHQAIPVIYALWSTRMRQLSSSIYFPDLTRKTSLVSRIYIYESDGMQQLARNTVCVSIWCHHSRGHG